MLRWLLPPLLLLTTSENTVPTGMASTAGGVSVNVYAVGVAAMGEMVCAVVAMSVVTAPMVLRSVTVMVRLSLLDVPVRFSNSVTLKLRIVQRERALQRHVHREGLRLVVAIDGDRGVVCRRAACASGATERRRSSR